ncbi:MAG: hypothetical protein DSM106950_40070 [Stigonema ocellatum SAG 48.90 = DSM 106950]|nr:hypothetical protein [Stigonema ocellatum SAG 48.90 = DSM 106950]
MGNGEVGRWGGGEMGRWGECSISCPLSPHLPISILPTPHSPFPIPHSSVYTGKEILSKFGFI